MWGRGEAAESGGFVVFARHQDITLVTVKKKLISHRDREGVRRDTKVVLYCL